MCFDWLFKERKTGYSIRGFWGQLKHYNKDGVQIGYTVRGFWGQRKRYDMNGNLLYYTARNFWGGYNTYDPQGNLIRRSHRNLLGGFNTYDKYGKKTHVSRKSFWDGLNHYEMDNEPKYETTYTVQKKSTYVSVGNTISQPSKQENAYNVVKKPLFTEEKVSAEVKKETVTVNKDGYKGSVQLSVENKSTETKKELFSLNDIPYTAPKIDKSATYVSTEEKFLKVPKEDCAKVLVLSYENMKEFPAVAYLSEGKVIVEPLILGEAAFEFDPSEIEKAVLEKVDGLDMNAVDTEFAAVCISDIGNEYEELLPEYSWEYEGTSRNQYVFECGMIITEKSMKQLRNKINQQ